MVVIPLLGHANGKILGKNHSGGGVLSSTRRIISNRMPRNRMLAIYTEFTVGLGATGAQAKRDVLIRSVMTNDKKRV
jgi:hypothetical protein